MKADVLVIEDVFGTIKGTVKMLETRGANIVHVETVKAAKEALQERTFALVLLDWRLPSDVSEPVDPDAAAQILKSLRDHPQGPNSRTPILIVTAQKSAVDQHALADLPNPLSVFSKLRPDRIFEAAGNALSTCTGFVNE